MTLTTHDNEKVTGSTPTDIITSLKSGSRFDFKLSQSDYMKALAMRWMKFSGKLVRTTTEKVFVEDLIKTGFLIKS